VHDYRKKKGVAHCEIILPKNSPEEFKDREKFWNAVEMKERKCNSRLAREIRVAIPHELNTDQKNAVVREFAKEVVDRYRIGADICIHEPHKVGDHRNDHAHVMLTTRRIGEEGLTEKTRELDLIQTSKAEIQWIREAWGKSANKYLALNKEKERIDHRSHESRGLKTIPTLHVGVTATSMERKGLETERGTELRGIQKLNFEFTKVEQELSVSNDRHVRKEVSSNEKGRDITGESGVLEGLDRKIEGMKPWKEIYEGQVKEGVDRIDKKATRLRGTLMTSLSKCDEEMTGYIKNPPKQRRGIRGLFEKKKYKMELEVWTQEKEVLRDRIGDISRRIKVVGKYTRRYGMGKAEEWVKKGLGERNPGLAKKMGEYEGLIKERVIEKVKIGLEQMRGMDLELER